MKKCKKCGIEKELNEFHNLTRSKDGKMADCKECRNKKEAERRKRLSERKEEDIKIPETKRCPMCKTVKKASDFSRNNWFLDGLDSGCVDCKTEMRHKREEKTKKRNKRVDIRPENKLCPDCKIVKEKDEFAKCISSLDGLSRICLECGKVRYHNSMNREVPEDVLEGEKECKKCGKTYSKLNFSCRIERKDFLLTYCKNCASERWKKSIEFKTEFKDELGGKCVECVECGEDDYRVLEFDHLRDKEINISQTNRKNALLEYDKCQLLCIICHRKKSVKKIREKFEGKETKNPTVIKRRQLVRDIKLEIGSCKFCERKVEKGLEHIFDFDHINEEEKYKDVAVLKNGYKLEKLLREINKCQLLCAKCHRIKTLEKGYLNTPKHSLLKD